MISFRSYSDPVRLVFSPCFTREGSGVQRHSVSLPKVLQLEGGRVGIHGQEIHIPIIEPPSLDD